MLHLYAQIEEACAAVRQKWAGRPRAGIILGTGIGPLAQEIETEASIDYETVPHFLRPTATSHRGRLVCGQLAGASVVAMIVQGRTMPAPHADDVLQPGSTVVASGTREGIAALAARLRAA